MWSRFVMSQVKHNSYFIVGMMMGLWVSLAVIPLEEEVAVCAAAQAEGTPLEDEFEPRREEKPLGSGGQTAGRALQRPRYYSTELGMRGSLLTGVLSSEEALKVQVPALNRTLARLQPALKFFITASAMSSMPGLANVVGFTDTREMLKPFHALKYLADNYLEEYDFFFLITDTSFVNVRRLTELVGRLSVSQDIYMGIPADGDSQYCDLESGVILSNSVLRAVHSELEWCVRNSYSPHHHENVGRCVLHAAHTPCRTSALGQEYRAVRAAEGAWAELAGAVAARGAGVALLPALHAYCARALLQRDRAQTGRLRVRLGRLASRHPPGYRNVTWPAGLRGDPGLALPQPDNRFSHLRWTLFNATHAYMADEVHAVTPIAGAAAQALEEVVGAVAAWGRARWGGPAALVEGAWQWQPAGALRYRLVVRAGPLRLVEVARPLGAARLVPVRYVTESARLSLLVPVPAGDEPDAQAFLARYEQLCLLQDKNTHLYMVSVGIAENSTEWLGVLSAAKDLSTRYHGSVIDITSLPPKEGVGEAEGDGEEEPDYERQEKAMSVALKALSSRLPKDALLLLMPPHIEFNQDFLNRVRMNTIPGSQWYLPMPFSRYAQYAHPAFRTPAGGKPAHNTGRFASAPRATLFSVYKADLDDAWRASRGGAAQALARWRLVCVRAPEPGAVAPPRGPPCPRGSATCRRRLAFSRLDLGARAELARLLLQREAAD